MRIIRCFHPVDQRGRIVKIDAGLKPTTALDFFKRGKVRAILIGIAVCILIIFYSYFMADTVKAKITDAQMPKVDGRYMIATKFHPFLN
jgi:hypothetical protein